MCSRGPAARPSPSFLNAGSSRPPPWPVYSSSSPGVPGSSKRATSNQAAYFEAAPAGAQVPEGPEGLSDEGQRGLDHDLDLAPVAFLKKAKKEPVGSRPLPGRGVGGALGSPHQPVAFRVGAEVVVDMVQERGVAFQGGRGLEDRAQEERIDPEALEVVEALEDAGQIAAVAPRGNGGVEVTSGGTLGRELGVEARRPGGELPVAQEIRWPGAAQVGGLGVVARVAVLEAVDGDRVPDRVGRPGWRARPRGGAAGRGRRARTTPPAGRRSQRALVS